jgi:CRP-like cAMP-binding protein
MEKILIIGNDVVRSQISEVLERANYNVYTASNREEGIEIALTNNPDFIICDDSIIPGQNGYDLLQLKQTNNVCINIPLIFLSSKDGIMQIENELQLCASNITSKPYEKESQMHRIKYLLAKAERMTYTAQNQLYTQENIPVCFSDIKNSDQQLLNMLDQTGDIILFKKKQIIFLDGNRAHYFYCVKKGKIKAYKNNEVGKELIVGFYGEGDLFGHVALLAGAIHNHSTKAIENSELLVIPKQEFEAIVFHNPLIGARFISLLIQGLNEKNEQLLKVAYNSLRQKVADSLLAVSEKYKTNNITLSRENLAAIAGTATASLIRTLSEFKDENIIEIKRSIITIVSLSKLKKIAQ